MKYIIWDTVSWATILERLGDWHFKLKCNICWNISTKHGNKILSNKSCGCKKNSLLRKYKPLDIIWWATILEYLDDSYIKLKCNICWKEKIIFNKRLNNLRHTKSCWCLKSELLKKINTGDWKELIWRKIRRLTILKQLKERNKFNRAMFVCLCDCWNLIKTTKQALLSGHTKSCWCLRKNRDKFVDPQNLLIK